MAAAVAPLPQGIGQGPGMQVRNLTTHISHKKRLCKQILIWKGLRGGMDVDQFVTYFLTKQPGREACHLAFSSLDSPENSVPLFVFAYPR